MFARACSRQPLATRCLFRTKSAPGIAFTAETLSSALCVPIIGRFDSRPQRTANHREAAGMPARNSAPLIGIIMGSQSDWPTLKHAADIMEELGIAYEARIVSAHRTPERLYEYAKSAAS